MKTTVISALLALAVTLMLAGGTLYFVRVLWPLLPPWLSVIVYVLIAIMVIGYPIYTLARWSDRYLARQQEQQKGKRD